MTLNSAIQSLYSSNKLVKCISHEFNYTTGFGIDSAFNNHVTESNGQIIIQFPEPINIVTGIKISHGKFKLLDGEVPINKSVINLSKYKNLKLVIYDISDYSKLSICWDIYLIKNNLISSL